ncbi:MAG: acyl-CoA dehydrogenase family protein [Candidatus Nanopelagicales bacterium]
MAVTHDVVNQVPPREGHDVFGADDALVEAVVRHGGHAHLGRLSGLGVLAGTPEARAWGEDANEHVPVLRTHDRFGHRVDEVTFHPSWHELMTVAVAQGLNAAPWTSTEPAPHVARAAGFMVWSQVEAGHGCPMSMTYASVPALRVSPDVAADWVSGLASTSYDFGLRPAAGKAGLVAGMAMTEKQGGSDVRTNSTVATPVAGDEYLLTGHKWFCSAPMSDVFLVLAQAPGGLTCFVVPRVLPDGTRNVFRLQRLKNKLGNRSNASAEIEFEGTLARRLGDEGRGVRTIVEMVSATRLDCVLGSTALMRVATSEAVWHATHRSAFGAVLVDQPLMRGVLADLALEVEAATALGIRLAAAVDAAEAGDEQERLLRRIALPASKYWVTKRAEMLTGEALECLGGNGYVEDSGLPRIYREAPVNSVWEGSGNVNALDLLRALSREPGTLDALLAELGTARGADPRYDAAVTDLLDSLADASEVERRARRLAERVAVLLQASLLLRYAPDPVADAFVATRVDGDSGATFGTLPRGVDLDLLVARADPAIPATALASSPGVHP